MINLTIFFFIFSTFWFVSKKYLFIPKSLMNSFFNVFFQNIRVVEFQVFKFRSIINLKLIFLYGMKQRFLSPYRQPAFQNYLLKIIFFLIKLLQHLVQILIDHISLSLFSKISSVPLIYLLIFIPISHCLNFYSFIIGIKIKYCESYSCVILFKIIMAILSPCISKYILQSTYQFLFFKPAGF